MTTTTTRDYLTETDEFGRDCDPQPMLCNDCARPAYYDYADENYHHAVDATTPCFLIAAEDRADDTEHPLVTR